jgi:broad specificity phosphatase PhoE
MTVWHWVRHGPTHEKTFVGWRDVPADLSDTAALERLRAHLPEVAVVVSSDLIRASATADALQGDAHVRLPHDAHLRELDFGKWDGMHFSEVADSYPELSRAYWETPGDVVAPEGESWNQAARRVNAVVDRVNAQYSDHHIIAVAHFGVILTQLQRALGTTPDRAMSHKIDNLSVTELSYTDGQWQAAGINHCP